MKSSYDLFIEKCNLLNTLAGKGVATNKTNLVRQFDLVMEESKELHDAVNNEPLVNILQETIDVLVVTQGMVQLLESLGCDVQGALQAVADCNLSKYTKDAEVAAKSVKALQESGVECAGTYNAKADLWVITDSNGKVRKPIGFKKVELSKFVPY